MSSIWWLVFGIGLPSSFLQYSCLCCCSEISRVSFSVDDCFSRDDGWLRLDSFWQACFDRCIGLNGSLVSVLEGIDSHRDSFLVWSEISSVIGMPEEQPVDFLTGLFGCDFMPCPWQSRFVVTWRISRPALMPISFVFLMTLALSTTTVIFQFRTLYGSMTLDEHWCKRSSMKTASGSVMMRIWCSKKGSDKSVHSVCDDQFIINYIVRKCNQAKPLFRLSIRELLLLERK